MVFFDRYYIQWNAHGSNYIHQMGWRRPVPEIFGWVCLPRSVMQGGSKCHQASFTLSGWVMIDGMHDNSYLFLFDSVQNVNNLFFPGLEFLLLLTKSIHLCLGKEVRANLWSMFFKSVVTMFNERCCWKHALECRLLYVSWYYVPG